MTWLHKSYQSDWRNLKELYLERENFGRIHFSKIIFKKTEIGEKSLLPASFSIPIRGLGCLQETPALHP
jgi:hypothetical protein